MAYPMNVRAQMTLPDGKTPAEMRFGAAIINACIARGCKIVPNPRNILPDEYKVHILRLDDGDRPVLDQHGHDGVDLRPAPARQDERRKRGRPRKVKP
jgi:hypothetical protein